MKSHNKVMKRCRYCKKQYELGRNGVSGSCDTCARISRDRNGYAWGATEETHLYENVGDGQQFIVTRSEAFGEQP